MSGSMGGCLSTRRCQHNSCYSSVHDCFCLPEESSYSAEAASSEKKQAILDLRLNGTSPQSVDDYTSKKRKTWNKGHTISVGPSCCLRGTATVHDDFTSDDISPGKEVWCGAAEESPTSLTDLIVNGQPTLGKQPHLIPHPPLCTPPPKHNFSCSQSSIPLQIDNSDSKLLAEDKSNVVEEAKCEINLSDIDMIIQTHCPGDEGGDSSEKSSLPALSQSCNITKSHDETVRNSIPNTVKSDVGELNKTEEKHISQSKVMEQQEHPAIDPSTDPLAHPAISVSCFRNLVLSETENLNQPIDEWSAFLEDKENECPSDVEETDKGSNVSLVFKGKEGGKEVCDEIRTVIGKTRLVIRERFPQFSQLINQADRDHDDFKRERPVLLSDLQGFWDMIYFQVEDVQSKFKTLDEMRVNNWKMPSPALKPSRSSTQQKANAASSKRKPTTATSKKKATAKSSDDEERKRRAAARKRVAEARKAMAAAASQPADDVVVIVAGNRPPPSVTSFVPDSAPATTPTTADGTAGCGVSLSPTPREIQSPAAASAVLTR